MKVVLLGMVPKPMSGIPSNWRWWTFHVLCTSAKVKVFDRVERIISWMMLLLSTWYVPSRVSSKGKADGHAPSGIVSIGRLLALRECSRCCCLCARIWSEGIGVAFCSSADGVNFLLDCHMHMRHGNVKSNSRSLPWFDHAREVCLLLLDQEIGFLYCRYPIPPMRYASLRSLPLSMSNILWVLSLCAGKMMNLTRLEFMSFACLCIQS